MNFLTMLGTAEYWARLCVAIASAVAISLDAFHRRIRAAGQTVFPR